MNNLSDLDKRAVLKLAALAKAAAEISGKSSKEALEKIIQSVLSAEQQTQKVIDSIMAMQPGWPMPEENWKQFIADIEFTNKKRGWNLVIKQEVFDG